MAQPPPAEIALYRQALRDADTLAQRDLLEQWRRMDFSNPTEARDALMEIVAGLVGTYYLMTATVAADWYDLGRHAAGVRKRFTAVIPEPPDPSRSQALVRWGLTPLFTPGVDPNSQLALSNVSGGLQRVVNSGARDTIVRSSRADPQRVGWVRVGTGECDWCQQYLDGEVHYIEGYDFDAHDRCQCDAVPYYGD